MTRTAVVVGTGYIGLPAAILLAAGGYDVVGVDIDPEVVAAINSGRAVVRDEDLRRLLERPDVAARLRGAPEPCPADAFLIAVPTPLDPATRTADLSMVVAAAEAIVPHLRPGNLVVLESTVPPRTCRDVVRPILERSGLAVGRDLLLAHCPERILPGDVHDELVYNDRVIGAEDEASRQAAIELYRTFAKGNLFETDDLTAEATKLMENAYRDVNIALANQFAAICDSLGVDAAAAIALANHHPRVDILSPGIGVGGHCIPIDPWFLAAADPANASLIEAARRVNDAVPARIVAKIRAAVAHIDDPKIVAVGAAYKPDTDDTRESPATSIVELLRDGGYHVVHHDPLVASHRRGTTLAEVCAGADCLAVLVAHTEVVEELAGSRRAIEAQMRHPIVMAF